MNPTIRPVTRLAFSAPPRITSTGDQQGRAPVSGRGLSRVYPGFDPNREAADMPNDQSELLPPAGPRDLSEQQIHDALEALRRNKRRQAKTPHRPISPARALVIAGIQPR